ncbi:MAG TPA: phage tail tip lysozyme [Propylenella sp.]
MADDALFREKAPRIMGWLMVDFGLNDIQAAGILGNIGHECAGFRTMHEIGQPEGRGGYGWVQWTGPRREAFFAWCRENGMDWQADEANYGFLCHELKTSERRTLPAIRESNTLEDATQTFEREFERAGVKHYASREKWARTALDGFRAMFGR